jgi:putative ABC transport system permease protein
MVGVTLFLLLWGAYQALDARDTRTSWMNVNGTYNDGLVPVTELSNSEALITQVNDYYRGASIELMDVATTSTTTLTFDALETVPSAGEYYASPAAADLIASVPANELGDRYGDMVGVLPDTMLASPDSLAVIAGRTINTLADRDNMIEVHDLAGRDAALSVNYQAVTIIGGIAVLMPVLLLVGIVTQLGATERRERFATLRLIGAPTRVITAISAWETAATALVGGVAGIALAYALRPVAALVSIDSGTFYVDDLTVSLPVSILVVLATVVASTVTAVLRIRAAQIGPLGAARSMVERAPSWRRLILLVAGLLLMIETTFAVMLGIDVPLQGVLLIIGFVMTAIGLLIAGPYLTFLAGRLMSRFSTSAEGVIAANRIRRTPAATFRAVSGLVVAVFMVSVFAGAATTGTPEQLSGGALPAGALVQSVSSNSGSIEERNQELDNALAGVAETPGVTGVARLFVQEESDSVFVGGFVMSLDSAETLGLVAAEESVPAGPFVWTPFDLVYLTDSTRFQAQNADAITAETTVYSSAVVVTTDGTPAAIERARTALELAPIAAMATAPPGTPLELAGETVDTMAASYASLAYLGIGVATFIAAFSLAISAVAAVLDRKRVLGLLRLLGMPVSALRRIVGYEAAVPLLAVVALSIGLGFGVAQMILVGLTGGSRTIGWPDPRFLIALGASAVLAAAAVVTTFGTIRRNTEVTTTRFE